LSIAANAAPRGQWLGIAGWVLFALLPFLIAADGISYVLGAEAPPPVRWLTFAAVTLPLFLLPAIIMDMAEACQDIAWACWIPNLLVVETWIAMRGRAMAAV
jgi:hypothetical protein